MRTWQGQRWKTAEAITFGKEIAESIAKFGKGNKGKIMIALQLQYKLSAAYLYRFEQLYLYSIRSPQHRSALLAYENFAGAYDNVVRKDYGGVVHSRAARIKKAAEKLARQMVKEMTAAAA